MSSELRYWYMEYHCLFLPQLSNLLVIFSSYCLFLNAIVSLIPLSRRFQVSLLPSCQNTVFLFFILNLRASEIQGLSFDLRRTLLHLKQLWRWDFKIVWKCCVISSTLGQALNTVSHFSANDSSLNCSEPSWYSCTSHENALGLGNKDSIRTVL